MAKRKRQQKRQLTVGKLLAALLVLWAVGAGLWFHYDLPLPEPLAEEIKTVEKLAEEKLSGVWTALSDRLTALMEKAKRLELTWRLLLAQPKAVTTATCWRWLYKQHATVLPWAKFPTRWKRFPVVSML